MPAADPTGWPPALAPMLAEAGALPRGAAWAYEVKWDGVRAIVRADGTGAIDVRSRGGQDLTAAFPELTGLGEALAGRAVTLDGELIAFDRHGQQRFQAVQRRLRSGGAEAINRLAAATPVTLMVFDLLWSGGVDLTAEPWQQRRAQLEALALAGPHWQVPPAHEGDPRALVTATHEHQLEGIVAKRRDAPYRAGQRSRSWIKYKHVRHQAVVVGGWTPGNGARRGSFGALQVGVHDGESGQLRHVGGVGSGFADADLRELRRALEGLACSDSPFDGGGAPPKGTRFVRPELVAEVQFTEWSDDGSLRHPVFRGLRADLAPTRILREASRTPPNDSPSTIGSDSWLPATNRATRPTPATAAKSPGIAGISGDAGVLELEGITVPVRNLTKPMYPDDPAGGFSKGDVIAYYARVAAVLAPHLRGRAITRLRYPHGAADDAFFEKRAPAGCPAWVETVAVESGSAGVIDFVTLGPPATLLWLANLAALELHPSLHLGATPDVPTALVFDLDPGAPATIVECCRVALLVRELLTGLGLDAWAKTTGSKGLQLYAPLNVATTYETTKPLAQAIAALLHERAPQLVTSRMAKSQRAGRVFVDWSQNDAHKTTVSVYSLRGRRSPTVSTPVTWTEVEHCAAGDDPDVLRFTAGDVLDRLDAHGDLFAPVLTTQQTPPELRS